LDEYGYIEKSLSKSRFNRRLHAIDPSLWQTLFDLLAPKSSNKTMPLRARWWTHFRSRGVCDKSSASVAASSILIETVFSKLGASFSRKIHAVTPRGFELKIVCFLLAFSIQCL
jgi:hypothetical protein